ncbi:unnamed protein product [Phytophthora fragariaefolia]|uniref:Unnamed protein product n=1 Tax=Phytophthora fragariaefolia TaxID=1490495 RepID=A0A9W6U3L8_9STRA|nr:unnamed protein product [Phytophthora fragariaefolia]
MAATKGVSRSEAKDRNATTGMYPDRSRPTDGVTELGGDAKVRELDLAVAVEQDVGRFDVAVHALVGLEVRQRVEDLEGHAGEDVLRDGSELVDDVFQRAAVHILEREHHRAVAQKCPEEGDEARTLGVEEGVDLADGLIPLGPVVHVDHLERQRRVGGAVARSQHAAAGPAADDLAVPFQLLGHDAEGATGALADHAGGGDGVFPFDVGASAGDERVLEVVHPSAWSDGDDGAGGECRRRGRSRSGSVPSGARTRSRARARVPGVGDATLRLQQLSWLPRAPNASSTGPFGVGRRFVATLGAAGFVLHAQHAPDPTII